MRYLSIILTLLATTALGDFITIDAEGIDSKATGLDGSGVQIGMVEEGRSGKAQYDDAAHSASNTIPAGVYFQTSGGMAGVNEHVADHATHGAGVMIGKDEPDSDRVGVAPNAELHSLSVEDADVDTDALGINRLALLNGGAIKAINLNYSRDLQLPIEQPGKSHLTQFVDWSARQHDVLYVVAWGNSDFPEFRTPADNYNGITVAASTISEELVYGEFWFGNQPDTGDFVIRPTISILAPGVGVRVLGLNDEALIGDGTSLAAPHVTGAVALVQQYAANQMNMMPPNPRFGPNSQRHEVMKAVIMNSADKLGGVHGSNRTVVMDPNDWTTRRVV